MYSLYSWRSKACNNLFGILKLSALWYAEVLPCFPSQSIQNAEESNNYFGDDYQEQRESKKRKVDTGLTRWFLCLILFGGYARS